MTETLKTFVLPDILPRVLSATEMLREITLFKHIIDVFIVYLFPNGNSSKRGRLSSP